jgi:hypothetical protein
MCHESDYTLIIGRKTTQTWSIDDRSLSYPRRVTCMYKLNVEKKPCPWVQELASSTIHTIKLIKGATSDNHTTGMDTCVLCSGLTQTIPPPTHAHNQNTFWVLFGCCRLRLNPHVLEWIGVKFSSSSTLIHPSTCGLMRIRLNLNKALWVWWYTPKYDMLVRSVCVYFLSVLKQNIFSYSEKSTIF